MDLAEQQLQHDPESEPECEGSCYYNSVLQFILEYNNEVLTNDKDTVLMIVSGEM